MPDRDGLELVPGTLDLLILRILAAEPMHGWGIGRRIEEASGVFTVASPLAVAGWVVGQVGGVLGRGVLAGLVAAAIGTRSLAALLYGVPPHDPATALAILALVGIVGLVSTGLPALRAARIDPATALRVD